MNAREATQSAWVYYFNKALSDLTGMVDEYSSEGIKITGPTNADKLAEQAAKIADAATKKLVERDIPDEYWPTAGQPC